MTPSALARLHAAAFDQQRPWSASEFQSLLKSPHVRLFPATHGFALTRTIAGESELLTLAVDPDHQRQGIARHLCLLWLEAIKGAGCTAFLEVAADNHPALLLYEALGFVQVGKRPDYYSRKNGASVDAIMMQRDLTLGQHADSTAQFPESG